jgi:CHAP domain
VAIRLIALDRAVKKLGVVEHPPGSNRGVIIDEWNLEADVPVGSYWCCSFVHAMFKHAGFELPGGASVQGVRQAAHQMNWIVQRPYRGDLACFDLDEGERYGPFGDHIGFVERVLALRWSNGIFAGYIQTIEGNTAAQNNPTGAQSNGGGVFRRRRLLRAMHAEFVRVPGEVES